MVLFQIDAAVRDRDAVRFQQRDLPVFAAEGKRGRNAPVAVDHAVAGNAVGVGVDVQRVTHHARPAGIAREQGDLPVGGDSAARNAAHDFIDFFKRIVQIDHHD